MMKKQVPESSGEWEQLPAPSSDYEHVENFVEEIIQPQQQALLNSLFNVFTTIETIIKLQPQYSDFFRGILNKKKQLSTLENNEHVQINGESNSPVYKIVDQIADSGDLIELYLDTHYDDYDDVISYLLLRFQEQASTIFTNYIIIRELLSVYHTHYKD